MGAMSGRNFSTAATSPSIRRRPKNALRISMPSIAPPTTLRVSWRRCFTKAVLEPLSEHCPRRGRRVATRSECAPGNFCGPADAGDGGTCQTLRGQGQPCSDFGRNIPLAQTECSYRAAGNTGLWCDFFNVSTLGALDAAAWTCLPDQPLAGSCANGQECSSLLCDPGANRNVNACVASTVWTYPSGCAPYIVDASEGD